MGLQAQFAQTLAELARQGAAEAVVSLARALETGADASVCAIAEAALLSLPEGLGQDALCRYAFEEGNGGALAIAEEAGYVPSEPPLRAGLLALRGRWSELDAYDIDGTYLRAAHQAAAPNVRRRLSAAAREAGRAEWVQVSSGGLDRRRLAGMGASDWQAAIALLSSSDRALDAWRLAQEAPPLWARTLLIGMGPVAGLPEWDREDFSTLRALAEPCGRGEGALSDCLSRVATSRQHQGEILCLAAAPDGSLLASGSKDGTIHLWSLPDGRSAGTLKGSLGGWVLALAITPDGSLLASDGLNRIHMWRLRDNKYMGDFSGNGAVHALAVAPNGSLLAGGGIGGRVCLWRLPGGELAKTLTGHEGLGNALAFTPDGRRLVSGGSEDGTIGLWRLPDGAGLGMLRGHEGRVTSFAVTPDGSLLASASTDGTIKLWRLPDGELVKTLESSSPFPLLSLSVTSDGRLLASGAVYRTTRLWSLPDGECVATLDEGCGWQNCLAVTPHSNLLASGGPDGTIQLRRIGIAALAATPVAALSRRRDELVESRRDADVTAGEQAWLDFMLALVDRHRRFDVEVEVVDHVEVGEFDIEIGS